MLRSISATVMFRWSMRSIFISASWEGLIVRKLDEVVVGVADIERGDRADSPGTRSWPGDDRHAAFVDVLDDLGDRRLGDKAEIARPRGRLIGDKPRDVVGGMQVNLLLAKA